MVATLLLAAAAPAYALFLPSSYAPERPAPILYCMDAGARGDLALEVFRDAAERYGFIVAASRESRNGPWARIRTAVDAMWDDTHAKLAIDPERVYAAGFSGGGAAAQDLAFRKKGKVAGVISVGKGLLEGRDPGEYRFPVWLAAGTEDFNYRPVRDGAERLERAGRPVRLRIFPGIHDWFRKEDALDAIAWLDAQGNPSEEARAYALSRAREAEASGDVEEAYAAWKAIAATFGGAREDAERVASSPAYRKARETDRRLEREESALLVAFRRSYGEEAPFRPKRARERRIEALGVPKLLATWREGRDTPEGRSASRSLTLLHDSAFAEGARALADGNPRRAVTLLELAVAIAGGDAVARYDLACAWARSGDREEALTALAAAIASGFDDLAHARRDPDLESLRDDPEFERLTTPGP